MKKVLFLFLLVLCINISGQELYTIKTIELLDKYYEAGQLNGSVLVAEKGKILLHKAYGTAEFEAGEKIDNNSVFVLASISKSLTSLGILRLIDQGKLSLNDELTEFFPELPYRGVTIKQLISNTNGLPEYRGVFAEHWDRTKVAQNKDVIALMAEYKPAILFEPGSQFRYSNTGFVFLASIIEKVSGRDYEEFMREEVFKPLGMNRSLIYTRDKEYNINNFAFPYVRLFLLNPIWARRETIPAFSHLNYLDSVKGDVSAASCTEDLFNMDMALLKGKFISNALLQEAFTPVITDKAAARPDEGYGFGWISKHNSKGEKIVFHEGGMAGISTYNSINLEHERVVVVLSNTNFTRSLKIASDIELIFDGGEPAEPKAPLVVEIAKCIEEKGTAGVQEFAKELVNKGEYETNENEINNVGYEFIQQGNVDAALEYFKLNAELFPDSWNVHDSLGEGYMIKGDKELAIKHYRKSIELNPDNENGKNFLKTLEVQ
jgi:CubicO group peptidase (beta-lactamase class C family)